MSTQAEIDGDNAEQMRAIFDSPGGWTDTLNRLVHLADSARQ